MRSTVFSCLLFLISCNSLFADLILRDTTDSAVATGAALMVLTDNSLSSTPSIYLPATSSSRVISELRIYTARSTGTLDYSNFQFVIGDVNDVEEYRAEDFGSAVANNQQYSFVNSYLTGLVPSQINPILVQGHQAEELVFNGLSLELPANNPLHLVVAGIQQTPNADAIGLVFSDGNDFEDRFDSGAIDGGLLLNLDASLQESQYAVAIIGTTIPEPSATVVVFGIFVVQQTRRSRMRYEH